MPPPLPRWLLATSRRRASLPTVPARISPAAAMSVTIPKPGIIQLPKSFLRPPSSLRRCLYTTGCAAIRRSKVTAITPSTEVVPPATGKGCIDDMRHLADRYASLIEIETKRKEDEYLQNLEEWELKKTIAHQKKQPIRMADAPVKASTCYFFIPTQITKAKLLIHLAEDFRRNTRADLPGLFPPAVRPPVRRRRRSSTRR